MLNNFSPLPLKNEPLTTEILPLTFKLPVNSDPLIGDSTLNPYFGFTEAVIEPDAINVDNNASGVKAVLGMLNNFSPLPLKNEPVYKKILPVN